MVRPEVVASYRKAPCAERVGSTGRARAKALGRRKAKVMLPMLALGALQLGGSLLSGMGAKQSSAKQARLQMIADYQAREENARQLQIVNDARERLGRELLTIPETESVRSWVDTDAMMKAAERSGFNPVTWLNAGGMQAYIRSDRMTTGHNAADAYKLMIPEYALSQASQVPQQHSMLSALGAGLSAAGTAMGTQYRADMSYDLQSQRMAQMAMGGINQGMGLSGTNGLQTALSYGSQSVRSAGGALSAGGGVSPYAYPASWKPGDVEVTHPFGRGFIDPTVSNADVKETRYGEPGDWLFGVDTMLHDSVRNLSGRTLREWGQAAGMNIGDYYKKGDTSWAPSFDRWWNSPSAAPAGFGSTADRWWTQGWQNLKSNGLVQ